MKITCDTVSGLETRQYGLRGAGMSRVCPEKIRCEVCGNVEFEQIRLIRDPMGMMMPISSCQWCGADTGELIEPLCTQIRAREHDPAR